MRLAYADPPYPGKADRYVENTEVDHVDLIARLREYDGWALSTDEKNLRYVIGLCPEGTRTLAWCRPNVAPFPPYPFAAWEPVLCWPARPRHDSVRSYAEITSVGGHMARENYRGQKPRGFCEWVLRCLGAVPGDTLDDLFPGSGVMGETFDWFSRQGTLAVPKANHAAGARAEANRLRRTHDPLPGFERLSSVREDADFYRARDTWDDCCWIGDPCPIHNPQGASQPKPSPIYAGDWPEDADDYQRWLASHRAANSQPRSET